MIELKYEQAMVRPYIESLFYDTDHYHNDLDRPSGYTDPRVNTLLFPFVSTIGYHWEQLFYGDTII